MTSYWLLMLDNNRHMLGSKMVECATDREAIATAEKAFGTSACIEVWEGSRPVSICFNPYRPPGPDAQD